MQRIGILGGTFDPVHLEHLNIAKKAKKELFLDEVILMPTFVSPHKAEKKVTDGNIRYEMLKLAVEGEDLSVSDYEISKQEKSYTYKTLEYLSEEKRAELFFIVGADMLKNFKTWKNPERILSLATLVAFRRQGDLIDEEKERKYFEKTFGKTFTLLNYEGKNISSTKIRVYKAFGLSAEGYLKKSVEDFIDKTAVYKPPFFMDVLKNNLTEKRLKHTADVVVAGLKGAKALSLNEEKAFIACALHDVAKYLKEEDFPGFIKEDDVPQSVVHAFLGAYFAEHVLGIKDEDVLNAIRYHTSGRAKMSDLEKLVYVADMVEEGRTYDGVEVLRDLFYNGDFDTCFKECLKEETVHLINKGKPIFKETLNAYDYYIKEK